MSAARLRAVAAVAVASVATLLLPGVVLAHRIGGVIDTPLPLVVYVAGSAAAVALSFGFLALTDAGPARAAAASPTFMVPRAIRLALRGLGLLAWLWVVAQVLVGGASDADVASLFLWVYGWVGIAMWSALIGPIWPWIDPFTTLYDLLAWVGARLGLSRPSIDDPDRLPMGLGHWPAVAGFVVFIWLELAVGLLGGTTLGLVLVGYTIVTLALMGQFGRDAWRARGETFSVWFALLGRIAPLALAGPPERGRLRRRGFGGGLVDGPWTVDLLVLAALGAGSILYDGISQTPDFVRLFGFPPVPLATLLLAVVLGGLVVAILGVARVVGVAAMIAGLIPVAAGYLVAHYLTLLLGDGQRILVALSDPFQQGWDLFGTGFHEADLTWLPTSVVWGFQLAAVVGGHIVGAWAGHAVALRHGVGGRLAQLPLALVMVALTTATLWSLGQTFVFAPEPAG